MPAIKSLSVTRKLELNGHIVQLTVKRNGDQYLFLTKTDDEEEVNLLHCAYFTYSGANAQRDRVTDLLKSLGAKPAK